MMLFIVFGMLFAVACSNESEPKEDKEKQEQQVTEEEDETVGQEEEVEKEENVPEENVEPDTEESEKTEKNEANKEIDSEEEKAEKEDKQEEEKPSKESEKSGQELVDLGFDIFKAQQEEDYGFLASILAKGASLDKSAKTFSFEDVTYPHEQEFIQAKQSDVEYRYTHEEDDSHVIVGFAVVDDDMESSFTIDFQFVKEGKNWKMRDMDMNK